MEYSEAEKKAANVLKLYNWGVINKDELEFRYNKIRIELGLDNIKFPLNIPLDYREVASKKDNVLGDGK